MKKILLLILSVFVLLSSSYWLNEISSWSNSFSFWDRYSQWFWYTPKYSYWWDWTNWGSTWCVYSTINWQRYWCWWWPSVYNNDWNKYFISDYDEKYFLFILENTNSWWYWFLVRSWSNYVSYSNSYNIAPSIWLAPLTGWDYICITDWVNKFSLWINWVWNCDNIPTQVPAWNYLYYWGVKPYYVDVNNQKLYYFANYWDNRSLLYLSNFSGFNLWEGYIGWYDSFLNTWNFYKIVWKFLIDSWSYINSEDILSLWYSGYYITYLNSNWLIYLLKYRQRETGQWWWARFYYDYVNIEYWWNEIKEYTPPSNNNWNNSWGSGSNSSQTIYISLTGLYDLSSYWYWWYDLINSVSTSISENICQQDYIKLKNIVYWWQWAKDRTYYYFDWYEDDEISKYIFCNSSWCYYNHKFLWSGLDVSGLWFYNPTDFWAVFVIESYAISENWIPYFDWYVRITDYRDGTTYIYTGQRNIVWFYKDINWNFRFLSYIDVNEDWSLNWFIDDNPWNPIIYRKWETIPYPYDCSSWFNSSWEVAGQYGFTGECPVPMTNPLLNQFVGFYDKYAWVDLFWFNINPLWQFVCTLSIIWYAVSPTPNSFDYLPSFTGRNVIDPVNWWDLDKQYKAKLWDIFSFFLLFSIVLLYILRLWPSKDE